MPGTHDTQSHETLLELFRTQEYVASSLLKQFACPGDIAHKVIKLSHDWLEEVYLNAKSEFKDTFFDKKTYYNQRFDECLEASQASLVAVACVIISYKLETGLHWRFSDVVSWLQVPIGSKELAQLRDNMVSNAESHENIRCELLRLERKVLEWKGLIRCVSKEQGRVPWHWEVASEGPEMEKDGTSTQQPSPATAKLLCHEDL
jgi:hypothetical protein